MMTTQRIQRFEDLGFEWESPRNGSWEDRLAELVTFRKIHGHCNIPHKYSKNTKLGEWVSHQRSLYRLHLEGKKSFMTVSRVQELESLNFEWRRVMLCSTPAPGKSV